MATTDTQSESDQLSFFARLALAFRLFFLVLGNALLAKRVQPLASGDVGAAEPPPEPPPRLHAAPSESALQLLGLLQREGRLIDFLMEDMSGYGDAEIGAAARVVHDQCRKALIAHVKVERIRAEAEGTQVTVPPGFSAGEIRLVGQLTGQPPFHGVLTHAGWRALVVELPQLSDGHDVRVIAPAEVEL
jgi:hypothetical protein